jgi:hypothetical protein
MITQRFRPVFWVAGVAVATTGLYLVSLRVATERGRLEAIDRQIARTQREIRQLQTEIGTRASLRQLEKWNGEALAMTAPKSGQFLNSVRALATVDPTKIGKDGVVLPPIMVAAARATPAEAPVVAAVAPAAAPIINRSNKVAMLDQALLPKVAIAQLITKPKIEAAKPEIKAKAKPEKGSKAQ